MSEEILTLSDFAFAATRVDKDNVTVEVTIRSEEGSSKKVGEFPMENPQNPLEIEREVVKFIREKMDEMGRRIEYVGNIGRYKA